MNGWEENVVGGERVSNWWQVAMSDFSFLNQILLLSNPIAPSAPRTERSRVV